MCPKCGGKISKKSNFCGACGENLKNPGKVYCASCGAENDKGSFICDRCGKELKRPEGEPVYVENYLAWAIAATILCCWPAGIVSIMNAARVNSEVLAGQIDKARDSSEKAKHWAWVSFWTGLVVGTIYIIVAVAAGGTAK